MRLGKKLVIGAFVVSCLVGFCERASAQQHALYHVYHSLWELRDARIELKESRYQFGEHKVKAEVAINEAIRQLELVLKFSGEFARGEPKRFDFRDAYKGYPHHPHLHHAVVELRLAHKELKEARFNFGGHKEAALRDMDIAIVQIELLLKFARR